MSVVLASIGKLRNVLQPKVVLAALLGLIKLERSIRISIQD